MLFFRALLFVSIALLQSNACFATRMVVNRCKSKIAPNNIPYARALPNSSRSTNRSTFLGNLNSNQNSPSLILERNYKKEFKRVNQNFSDLEKSLLHTHIVHSRSVVNRLNKESKHSLAEPEDEISLMSLGNENANDARLVKIPTEKFMNKEISEIIQNKPIKKILKKTFFHKTRDLLKEIWVRFMSFFNLAEIEDKLPNTYIIDDDPYIDMTVFIRNTSKNDFVVNKVSDSDRFEQNMQKIRNRKPTSVLSFIDFSPKSENALREMGLPVEQVKGWQRNSKKINRLIARRNRKKIIKKTKPTIENLFTELRSGEGVVTIIYGHSDGENIYLDTANGVERFSKEVIEKRLGNFNGQNWLTPVVLLNCESRSILSKSLIDAGSPLVFSSDQKLSIGEIRKFLKQVFKAQNKDYDVIDAIYEGIKKAGPKRMSPEANLVIDSKIFRQFS